MPALVLSLAWLACAVLLAPPVVAAFGGAALSARAQHGQPSSQQLQAHDGEGVRPLPPDRAGAASAEPAHQEGGHEEGGGHGESIWATIARLVNFAILAGVLVYFIRSPFMAYLAQRSEEIRGDLSRAAAMREEAGERLAEVDRRLAALPGEIEALKARGAEEIRAEEARIRELAEAERARLLEGARREIDVQLRVAQRDLVRHAADLAVSLARRRIERTITEEDQHRLVDRYLEQVR